MNKTTDIDTITEEVDTPDAGVTPQAPVGRPPAVAR